MTERLLQTSSEKPPGKQIPSFSLTSSGVTISEAQELCFIWSRIHPPMKEMLIQSLVQEDPLEKEMATHSRILAWKIPWTEEPGGLWYMGSQRVRHD